VNSSPFHDFEEKNQNNIFLDFFKILIYSFLFISSDCHLMNINPIPTGDGLNQPIYSYHVTQAGRNRIKITLLDMTIKKKSISMLFE
jgi:hypothetical protein